MRLAIMRNITVGLCIIENGILQEIASSFFGKKFNLNLLAKAGIYVSYLNLE